MKAKEIPRPCNTCMHMKAWNMNMSGDHDFSCSKKPSSKYGCLECDKYVEKPVGNTELLRRMMDSHDRGKSHSNSKANARARSMGTADKRSRI